MYTWHYANYLHKLFSDFYHIRITSKSINKIISLSEVMPQGVLAQILSIKQICNSQDFRYWR